MQLTARYGRTLAIAAAAAASGIALSLAPTGTAHAVNFGVLVNGALENGPGRSCPASGAPGIYLYSDINYQGRCGFWDLPSSRTGYNDATIKQVVGNDKASSMWIVGANGRLSVYLYKHNNQETGTVPTRFTGNVPDFRAYTFTDGSSLNDNVSSLGIAP